MRVRPYAQEEEGEGFEKVCFWGLIGDDVDFLEKFALGVKARVYLSQGKGKFSKFTSAIVYGLDEVDLEDVVRLFRQRGSKVNVDPVNHDGLQ